MKRILILFLLFSSVISNCLFSINHHEFKEIKIWSECGTKEVEKFTSSLTIFPADQSKINHSAIILCPGGSYGYLGMNVEGYEVAKWLNSMGFTALVLKYRVGLQGFHYPAAIQDLQQSIHLVRKNAEIWNIDATKIGVMGFSAGGHLAGTAAIYYNENFLAPLGIKTEVSLRPDFVIMNYPVVSMHDSIAHKRSKNFLLGKQIGSKTLEDKLSLEDNVHSGMPPVFLMHAKGDETVDYRNSYYLNDKMVKANLSIKFILYDCVGHGFGVNPQKNAKAVHWTEEFKKWITNLGYIVF